LAGHAVSVPPLVLLACGVALVAIGTWLRSLFAKIDAGEPSFPNASATVDPRTDG